VSRSPLLFKALVRSFLPVSFSFFHSPVIEPSPLLKYQFNNGQVRHLRTFLSVVQRIKTNFVFMTTFVTSNISPSHFLPKLQHPFYPNYHAHTLQTLTHKQTPQASGRGRCWPATHPPAQAALAAPPAAGARAGASRPPEASPAPRPHHPHPPRPAGLRSAAPPLGEGRADASAAPGQAARARKPAASRCLTGSGHSLCHFRYQLKN